MIEVRYNKFNTRTLFGNNMFQYCLGRILAQELGYALVAEPIPYFPATADVVAGDRFESPVETLTGQIVDLAAVSRDRRPRKLLLEGWFQRSEYYRPYQSQIREWLAFDPAIRRPAERPDVVVHVRRTDFVSNGWALPFSFYESALSRLLPNGGDVWVLTDDPGDPFFRNFRKWTPRFTSNTAIEDLVFMTQAKRLVMSQSTFSWWAAFLGEPDEVICPVPSFGAWAGSVGEIALIESDRFTCIPCPEPYRMTQRESWHWQRRVFHRRVVLHLNRRFGWSLKEPINF
jgi:hypothetical protein